MPAPSRLARLLCRLFPRTMDGYASQTFNRGYDLAVTDCANDLRVDGYPGLAERLLDELGPQPANC